VFFQKALGAPRLFFGVCFNTLCLDFVTDQLLTLLDRRFLTAILCSQVRSLVEEICDPNGTDLLPGFAIGLAALALGVFDC